MTDFVSAGTLGEDAKTPAQLGNTLLRHLEVRLTFRRFPPAASASHTLMERFHAR